MNQLFCEELPQFYPSLSDFTDMRSTYISNCVFNNFLTYNAIMLNIVTIYAIQKSSSLPKTLKTFLVSLAVSDVGVGLVVQPVYTSLLVNWLQQSNSSCFTYMIFRIFGTLFSSASFLGVVAVSVDRFLAVHLHLRYQEVVTHKRVVSVVISVWVFSAFVSLLPLWNLYETQRLIRIVGVVIGFLFTAVVYIRIYLVARRLKNQIQSLQVQQVEQTGGIANFSVLINSAVGIFYVHLVFLICYLPFFICLAAVSINNSNLFLKRLFLFSMTLLFLNSSLNPLIYCWKMRHIRHAIMDILRNMPWKRNRALH